MVINGKRPSDKVQCFISKEELALRYVVRISSDYVVSHKKVNGKITPTYKSYDIYIAKHLLYNNRKELIDETVKRRVNNDSSYPRGWNSKKTYTIKEDFNGKEI